MSLLAYSCLSVSAICHYLATSRGCSLLTRAHKPERENTAVTWVSRLQGQLFLFFVFD
jgi:hypothetical protein